ncbi:Calcium/calmodulin-dependent protein kinase type I [Kickxella alabastrina]|uniref:Calcium/calmodulin-dependent protein kinase type I n=1 Tax=Kickxella alabastrina TaxID=61397 RepID=A0ACC1IB53_9FUNG|nr:Calcium/calmodulin-dependent protein kinase type I [Kickxella alabastrina]
MADILTHSTGISPQPHLRTTVPCKYRSGAILGTGTYAVVKEMQHIASGHTYAGKIINKRAHTNLRSISNELRTQLVLPPARPLLRCHDYFETPHSVYIITELCSGGELLRYMRGRNEIECIRVVRQLAEGLVVMHGVGVVHRDLKPENCLVRSDGSVAIADFGMARSFDPDLGPMTSVCGTPGYMAPEMVLRRGYAVGVDLWALGVVACFMLSGSNPFHHSRVRPELIASQQAVDALLENAWCSCPWVSATARGFVRALLAVDPEARLTAERALAHPWLAVDLLEIYFAAAAAAAEDVIKDAAKIVGPAMMTPPESPCATVYASRIYSDEKPGKKPLR